MNAQRVLACVVCGATDLSRRWEVDPSAVEGGVDARSFCPSSERFGETIGTVMSCSVCGHGALANPPNPKRVADAYSDATDELSIRERQGQLATADNGLARLEQFVRPGPLVDVGCWTGSFVESGVARGWSARGVDPSSWAVEAGRARGLDLRVGDLRTLDADPASMRAVALCDVLEHLEDPHDATARVASLLERNGALYLTVPDAGSALARVMGRRWWSVLPMHLHYFTRTSLLLLLAAHGLRPAYVGTHAKVFSARYYAERIGGYSDALGRRGVAILERAGLADRQVAPNFRDRMEVIALRC